MAPVTIHDLRHTFADHYAQPGVPLPRTQKLLGHASPVMTMRYMRNAPEAYFVEDAARIAANSRGQGRDGTRNPGGDCARKYQVGLTMSATNFATTRQYESVTPVPADLFKSLARNSLRAVSGAVAKW